MKLIVLIFSSFFIMLASLVGVFFTIKFLSDWTKKNIKYLLAFASGVFTIVSYNLVNEALELGANTFFVWMAIICGFLVFLIVERFYPDIHCHHDNQRCLSKDLNDCSSNNPCDKHSTPHNPFLLPSRSLSLQPSS